MKIGEAEQTYSFNIKNYFAKQRELAAKKRELDEKIKTTENGADVYKNEAAILELQYNAVNEKRQEYQNYMDKLQEHWASGANMGSGERQTDAMADAAK